ncbi:phosphopyruvate hydratase [Gimesia sp.]|uniref:phosphopyruvate hydratase n=1 Tax=Gimesia sp. TaxID=2024833 RepID=UPI000C557F77|nr:phosphopyruvate hydratase [Gimesia sp.]MAX38184.1 phosphopyruvate hydratase [Gimesia sp.]HAH44404.1 phosphopyruvate hydratase [Planctomycetaceae bacterium]|tara:strand:- start:25156 stop:26526 length:1371 start_codon:yes stop_codon:yes gene_type:complete
MTQIEYVHAREVFDSRGNPTVEVEICCAGSRCGRAIVPSGASTGKFEAVELRDKEAARFDGLGVTQAVENVRREIAAALIGQDASDQKGIDAILCELDGTENKSRLGANAILGASLATAYAAAESQGQTPVERFAEIWSDYISSGFAEDTEQTTRTNLLARSMSLPLPMVNMISGGLHAGRNLDFQDFLILPVGATSYRQAFEWIVTIYRRLGQILNKTGHEGTLIGDEGGYGPKLSCNSEAVKFIVAAIEASGLIPGEDVAIGLDVASTHFYDAATDTYHLNATGDEALSADDVIDMLERWVDTYPIISIEDGLAEDDWSGWKKLTERLGHRVQLIGDDLFVTNQKRLQQGIDSQTANSVLIKLNQIGTLTETLETLKMSINHGYWPVVSARSGETEDTTIADLVVATGAGQLKVGSVGRSERLAKYNQLLRLEEALSDKALYHGGGIFASLRSS